LSFFGFFKTAAVKVANIFVAIFGKAVADQFGAAVKAIVKTDVGKLAVDAVNVIENSSPTLGSTAKRDAAVAILLKDAAGLGITLAESVANLLIEIAVQYISGAIVL
jgi:citrate lyase gamma subunit